MRPGKGLLVTTKDGRIGRTYHRDRLINGKIPVYIMENGKETGEKIISKKSNLKFKGCID